MRTASYSKSAAAARRPPPLDRAAVVTQNLIAIFGNALRCWFDGRPSDLPAARAEIEDLLRDEFVAVERQAISDIRANEGETDAE